MFKKMKLASKLALTIGAILTVILAVLIGVTVSLSSNAIETSTYGELNAITRANSYQVQQVFDEAETAALSMQNYLNKAYKLAEEDPSQLEIPTSRETIAMCQSVIYDTVLSSLNYDVEQFMTETARNTAVTNEDIVGVGVMFEPFAFQSDLRDYAFYVNEDNMNSDIEPFGAYEEYSQEIAYQDALAAKQTIVTEPYQYEGKTLVSYGAPIMSGGEIQGVVMADIDINNFSKVNATNPSYPSMYATIYDADGTIIYDTEDTVNIGKSIMDFTPVQSEAAALKAGFSKGQPFQIETTREDGRKVTRFFNPVKAGNVNWWSLTAVDSADVTASVRATVTWMLILSVSALVLIILAVVFLLQKMLRPMQSVVEAAEQIAGGHLDVQVQSDSGDEIGVLSRTFQRMSDNLKKIVDDVKYLLGEMAEGNFAIKTRAESSYVGDFEAFLLSMRKLNSRLSETLAQINEASDQVSAGSSQVSSSAQALAQGATEQASSVEELAATINEISSHVRQTAGHTTTARQENENAHLELQTCNQQMRDLVEAMETITARSNEVSKIIKTIEDIASQTNILALNAAVEAARAGEAGKGFAVVADEVRSLAGKSADAARSTTALIEETLKAVNDGSALSGQTEASLMKVVENSQKVLDAVILIANASSEQAESIGQVTQGVDQISSVVQTNSATAEESAAASEELSGQAAMLKELVSQFKLKRTDDSASAGFRKSVADEAPVQAPSAMSRGLNDKY